MTENNITTIANWIYLLGPFFLAMIFSIREYGVQQALRFFTGFQMFCLLGPTLLIGQGYIYYRYGESWFCGPCRKGSGAAFLFPGLAIPLLTFPAYFAGRIFDSAEEKGLEILIFLLGFFGYSFFIMGVLSSN